VPIGQWTVDDYDVLADGAVGFLGVKRAKYLVCNITDATPKVIAVAKVRANIVIHICSSIAWQAGARPVSQPPVAWHRAAAGDRAPITGDKPDIFSPLAKRATLTMLAGQRLELAISAVPLSSLFANSGAEDASCEAVRREAEEDWGPVTKNSRAPQCGALCAYA
jgi:hypothetical protein